MDVNSALLYALLMSLSHGHMPSCKLLGFHLAVIRHIGLRYVVWVCQLVGGVEFVCLRLYSRYSAD